ncbi:MAG TPA: arylsulfatase [Bacteroidales bacterium]|nr:arylsulfatase [Bacteroidales bacterium]
MTTKDKFSKYLLTLSFLVCLFFFTGFKKKSHKKKIKKYPNIVLIVSDDLGYGDLGAYSVDNKIHTPNIDKLAASGVRFTDAHSATSLCSPSRYAILTGRYPWRTRLKRGVVASWGKPLINKGRITLATLLKKRGYYTAGVGKWHLGFNWPLKPGKRILPKQVWSEKVVSKVNWQGTLSGGPLNHGFDYYYGIPGSINMIPYVIIEDHRVTEAPIAKKTYYDSDWHHALRAPNWSTKMMGAKMTEKAVSIIDEHFTHHKDQPLFLYFPTTSIHRPDVPNFTQGWSKAGLRGDMVAQFDWTVGQIIQALKRKGQLNNTLLIITSDNGPHPGDPVPWLEKLQARGNGYKMLPKGYLSGKYYPTDAIHRPDYGPWMTYGHKAAGDLTGFKSDPWEGGHRIPFIVYWPDKIKEPRVDKNMLCLSDLLATFADITHQKLPKNAGEDSDDMLPEFLGKNKQPIRNIMVNAGGWDEFTLRYGKWDLINVKKYAHNDTQYPSKIGNGPELYNLKTDVEEKHNVIGQHPELVKKMRALLHKYQEQGYSANRLEKK